MAKFGLKKTNLVRVDSIEYLELNTDRQPFFKIFFQDFGGDKNNVTVIGHGQGAACLHFLMTSDALPHGQ